MRRACLFVCAMAVSEVTVAGGFALIEQGAAGLGNAYAGAAAVSEDASTVWFNPAGMAEIKEKQLLAAGHIVLVDSDFTDRGTTLNPAFGLGFVDPNFGSSGTVDPGGATFLPALHYVHPWEHGITFGIGLGVPFGNSSDYDPDWVGRYQATESSVSAIDINPSVAYRVNDKLNVGGGVSLQFFNAELGTAVDSGGTCFGLAAAGSLQLAECLGAGLTGPAQVETDGFALVATKIGLAYRHSFDHEIEGDADFDNNENFEALLAANGIPLFLDGGASAAADLPSTVMLSGAHQLTDKIELLADATWTRWNRLQELRIRFDNPAQPDTVTTLGYENVFRVSAGLTYRHNEKLTFRGGIALDEDPVPSPELRTPRIPGVDRTWIAAGVGYKVNDRIGVDVSYANLSLDDAPVDNASEAAGGTTLRGVFDTSAHIFSAQVTVNFD